MARDRLAALREERTRTANPRPDSSPGVSTPTRGSYANSATLTNGNNYELSTISNGTATSATGGDFYEQVSAIQDRLVEFNNRVSQISRLHSASLDTTADAAATQRNEAQLEALVTESRAASADLKNRITELQKQRGGGRDGQIQLVKTKFMEAIQNYQQEESEYRAKYKQRIARQFKIVKPDATEDEITAVVNDDQGSQVFTQALLNSNRYGASRDAYREVQERHEDVRRIERTLVELAQLFNDVSALVEKDDNVIDTLQNTTQGVADDTEAALGQTEKAKKSAIGARKKRWICFFITLIILAVIAIILAIEIPKKN